MKKGVGSGSETISQRYGSGSAPKSHGSPTLERTVYFWYISIKVRVCRLKKASSNHEYTSRTKEKRTGEGHNGIQNTVSAT
jgi:hypothetical protein